MMKTVESILKRLDQKYVDKFLRLAKNSKTIVISETELDVIKKLFTSGIGHDTMALQTERE